jgi:hypothetical protein
VTPEYEALQKRLGAALLENREVYRKLEAVRAELAAVMKEPPDMQEWKELAIREAQAAVDGEIRQQFANIRAELEKTQEAAEHWHGKFEDAQKHLGELQWGEDGRCTDGCGGAHWKGGHSSGCALAGLLENPEYKTDDEPSGVNHGADPSILLVSEESLKPRE